MLDEERIARGDREALGASLYAWGLFLGPPTLWFAHFGLVYGAASIELSLTPVAGITSRLVIAAGTLLTLAALALNWRLASRPLRAGSEADLTRFWVKSTRALCLLSAIAVIYQALPALLVP